jgi:micrococcal nuclease
MWVVGSTLTVRSNSMIKNTISYFCLLVAGLYLLMACQSVTAPRLPIVKINRVMSGQTVEWTDRSQQPPIIQQGRLMGIDAPDMAQEPWGKQAKQRLEELIDISGNSDVSIEFESSDADKFGRKFVYLWKDGRLLNEQLLREGCVLASMRNSSSSNSNITGAKYRDRFSRGSQYARLMGQGIWNPNHPMRMSPAEFRKEER